MKKMLRVLLIAMLCLMMALPAGATATQISAKIDADRFIANTNLMRVSGKEGYGLMTMDGTMITDTIYSNLTFDNGYITAAQTTLEGINTFGVMSMDGQVIVPFEYNILKVSRDFCVAVALEDATAASHDYESYSGEAFYNVGSVGIYHLPTATKIATLTRDQYLDHKFVNGYINIQDRTTGVITTYDETFTALGTVEKLYDDDFAPARYQTYRENGQYGVKDAAGNIIMPPSYQNAYYSESYNAIEISTGEASGLVDLNGKLLVAPEFDSFKPSYNLPATEETNYRTSGYKFLGKYFCAVKDGKMCFVDIDGNITFGPKYSKDIVEVHGASLTLQDLEGNTIIVAADGVETTVTGYERVTAMSNTSGYYFRVTNADGKYGLIDWHGVEVMPCEFGLPSISNDGRYIIASKDYKNNELYELTYPEAPAAEQPAAEEPAVDAAPVVEAPAADAAPAVDAPAATGTNAAAVQLINSAITLLNSDAATNGATAVSLLTSASTLIADASAAGLVTSASTLISSDAAGNAAAAISLLQSAVTMLP